MTATRQDHRVDTQYDERKFSELLLYLAARLQDDASGGATKLNKALFFAEFAHVRRAGRPDDFLGYRQHRLVPKRAADVSVFSAEEIETIDKVLTDLDGSSARQVSDLSQEEAGWRLVDFGDTIPYEAALVGARQVSTPTAQRLQREAATRLGLITT